MRGLKLIFQGLYFLFALVIMGGITYVFGHSLLFGNISGNDFPYALTYTAWLNRFFPHLPLWFPLQGGGLSFVQNSQLGGFYLPILLDRLSPLNLIQAFRLWPFLSVPLTCLGIYFFVWHKLKSQTAALLAAFFYPLSQATWTWLYDTGLYAQSVSLIFVVPVIFLFDLYLNSKGQRKYIGLVATSLLLAILAFTHLASGISVMETLFLYGFFWVFFEKKGRTSLAGLIEVVAKVFLVITIAILLVGFWLFPYLRYLSIVNRGGLLFPGLEALPHFKIGGLLGILGPEQAFGVEKAWYMFFATPVLIWAGIGLILAAFRKRPVLGWGIIAFFFMFQTSLPDFLPVLPSILEKFWTVVTIRAIVPTMIFLPMITAFGIEELSKLILFPLRNFHFRFLSDSLKVILVFVLLILSLVYFRHVPSGMEDYLGYGPAGFYGATFKDGKIGIFEGEVWVPWQLSLESGLYFEPLIHKLNDQLALTKADRVDISPDWGGIIQAWSLFSDVPLSTTYNVAGLPNWPFWGYQQGVFYNQQSPGTIREVNQLAQHFGITYALIYRGLTPVERYDQSWEEVLREKEALTVLQFKEPTGAVEITSRPVVLVIGSSSKNAYETIFRLANLGVVDYKEALLVEGKEKVDDYGLEELKNFTGVILYGYSFKNREKAWQMLDKYVKEGGRLFVETGWQYVSPDWQMETVPEVIPVDKVSWQEYKDWDLEGFSPPSYKGGPWGVAAGENLKNWAEVVIESKGKVLVAKGNYGQGKIVWSGMNLPGHAFIYKNDEEYGFFKELLSWLMPLGGERRTDVKINRDYPDRVEFAFSHSKDKREYLYFKENFFPDWQASLAKTESLPIYRAGPNFMLIPLNKVGEGERVILEYKPSLTMTIFRIISLLTLLALIFGFLFRKVLARFSLEKFGQGKIRSWWEEEDEI